MPPEKTDPVELLERRVERHERILKGDDDTNPPKVGVVTILERLADKVSDPNTGLGAHEKRISDIETWKTQLKSYMAVAVVVAVCFSHVMDWLISLLPHR